MKSSNLIAIGGLKNSGKDTAAKMLQYLLNSPKFMRSYWAFKLFKSKTICHKYKIISFASPLKKTLATLLDVPVERFEDRNFKENYYIYFPTLEITNTPDKTKVLNDNKFSRLIGNKDLSFVKTHYITIRQLLQVFGTECMREIFGDKLWILLSLRDNKPTIVSDLRFKTEFKVINEKGGSTIYIQRDSAKPGNHASEKELIEMLENKQFTAVVCNNGTLKELFNNLKSIL